MGGAAVHRLLLLVIDDIKSISHLPLIVVSWQHKLVPFQIVNNFFMVHLTMQCELSLRRGFT